ncbi:Transcriptional adapter ada2, variant 3 [Entomophthora muscae]|uniref:Transcriptional adapter ada2, variant 3 n=1 Tax=Entomophthora muscae TaxID=34485 RepID=A0ACC2RR08_9FUNG|nr:Transcriptional adapter ada2, variant 3 [Entomophthora muscae]
MIIRIRCAECEEFDLCVYCFQHGEEIGEHKNSHAYRIIRKHTFPIFDPEWGADEELLLLEALEINGMGNWAAASAHIGSKTDKECESHYIKTYLQSETRPLPDLKGVFKADIDTTLNREFIKPPTSKNKVWYSQPSNHDVQGYMPGRLEFETEFEEEGENTVKDLAFHEDDTAEEIEFKLALLDAYNNKLNKREYRKRFLTERGIVDYKKNQAADKKRSREEKEIFTKYKVFARLHTAEDHTDLIKGLLKEQELKTTIAKLQEYKSMGIQTFAEAENYEKAKDLRDASSRTPSKDKPVLGDRSSHNFLQRLQEETSKTNWNQPSKPEPVKKDGLDLTGAEGLEFLSASEKELCSSLRLLPKTYLIAKKILICEYLRAGSLHPNKACDLVQIEPFKASRIYDFFVRSRWIPSTAPQNNEVLP